MLKKKEDREKWREESTSGSLADVGVKTRAVNHGYEAEKWKSGE